MKRKARLGVVVAAIVAAGALWWPRVREGASPERDEPPSGTDAVAGSHTLDPEPATAAPPIIARDESGYVLVARDDYPSVAPGTGATVRGRVTGANGARIPSTAAVGLHELASMEFMGTAPLGDDPRFEFRDVVAGVALSLSVSAPGFRHWSRPLELERGAVEDLDVVLEAAPTEESHPMTGVIRDRSGRAVRGARIEVPGGYEGTSDDDGGFTFRRRRSQCTMIVSHEEFALHRESLCGHGDGAVPTSIEITLSEGTTIRGEVVDQGGKPVADALIECDGKAHGSTRHLVPVGSTVSTDARGRFELPHLPVDTWTCGAYRYGYDLVQRPSVTVAADMPTAHAAIALSRWLPTDGGSSIEGTIVSGDGAPLERPQVYAEWPGHRSPAESVDEAGHFVIRGLPAGAFSVTGQADDYTSTTRHDVATGTKDVRLVIHRPGRLSLQVLDDASGEPVAGADVHGYGRTGLDGSYLFEWLPREPTSLSVRAPGYVKAQTAAFAAEPERTVEGTVRLTRGGIARGAVVDASGAPRAGVAVWACGGEISYYACELSDHQIAVSRRSGEFTITGLANGRWHLRARDGESYGAEWIEIRNGRAVDDVRISLDGPVPAFGRE